MKFRDLLEAKVPEIDDLAKEFKYGRLYAQKTQLEDVPALKLKDGDKVVYIRKLYVKGSAYELDWEQKGKSVSDQTVKTYKDLIKVLDKEFGFNVLKESTGEKVLGEIFTTLINQIPKSDRKRATPLIEDELYQLLNSGNLNLPNVQELFKRHGANLGLVKQFFK
jgi:uncharacterized Zn ribbon protein